MGSSRSAEGSAREEPPARLALCCPAGPGLKGCGAEGMRGCGTRAGSGTEGESQPASVFFPLCQWLPSYDNSAFRVERAINFQSKVQSTLRFAQQQGRPGVFPGPRLPSGREGGRKR